jgi:hypothetical protein
MPLGQSQITVHFIGGGMSLWQYPLTQLWPRAHSHDATQRLRQIPLMQSSLAAQSWLMVHDDEGAPPPELDDEGAPPPELDDDAAPPPELDDDADAAPLPELDEDVVSPELDEDVVSPSHFGTGSQLPPNLDDGPQLSSMMVQPLTVAAIAADTMSTGASNLMESSSRVTRPRRSCVLHGSAPGVGGARVGCSPPVTTPPIRF